MSVGYKAPPLTSTYVWSAVAGIPQWTIQVGSLGAHNTLTVLGWTASGHTGTASTIAGFSGAGAAAEYAIGTDLQAWDANLDQIAALAVTDSNIMVGNGSAWVAESGATARTSLGVAIGSDVQAWGANLDDLVTVGAVPGDSYFLVGTGAGALAWETTTTARTSIGLGTTDDVDFAAINGTGYLTMGTSAFIKSGFNHAIGDGNLNVEGQFAVVETDTQPKFFLERWQTAFGTLNFRASLQCNTGDGAFNFSKIIAGASTLKFNAIPTDTTSNSFVLFGQSNATSGRDYYRFYTSGTVDHQLADNGVDSYLCSNGGFLAVGTTSASYQLDVHDTVSSGFVANFENDSSGAGADGVRIKVEAAAANTGNLFLEFVDAGGSVGSVAGDGTGVSFNVTSDRDKKTDIEPAPRQLESVRTAPLRSFTWIASGVKAVGAIAQEMAAHFPDLVLDPTERNARRLCVVYDYTEQADETPAPTLTAAEQALPAAAQRELLQERRATTEMVYVDRVERRTACTDATGLAELQARETVKVISSRPLAPGDDGWTPWQVNYMGMVPRLWGSVRDLADDADERDVQIAALTATVAALARRLEAIESRGR